MLHYAQVIETFRKILHFLSLLLAGISKMSYKFEFTKQLSGELNLTFTPVHVTSDMYANK